MRSKPDQTRYLQLGQVEMTLGTFSCPSREGRLHHLLREHSLATRQIDDPAVGLLTVEGAANEEIRTQREQANSAERSTVGQPQSRRRIKAVKIS